MFRHQGPSRSERHNAVLAAYLACVAGFVNSAGFVLAGSFTSHATGNVGRLADDLATRDWVAAGGAFTMLIAFFSGACVASLIIESRLFSRTPTAYGVALSCEAVLLGSFGLITSARLGVLPLLRDAEAVLLCLAMGAQNSLVTRLSGAVVRTTHLTGVVTDLGIETARWLVHWRRRSQRNPPVVAKIRLHLTILVAFIAGAIAGCALALRWHAPVVLLPTAAVIAAAVYAFANARGAPLRESHRPRPLGER
jgi:uncharacterized membrane protein YoaK (UPF0700 family)